MVQKGRSACDHGSSSHLEPGFHPKLEPDPRPTEPADFHDEVLDAFLPDDDLEPLPEPADFWTDQDFASCRRSG